MATNVSNSEINSLITIIDYLKTPSLGEVEDYGRRRSLWKALKIDEKKHNIECEKIKSKYKRQKTINDRLKEENDKHLNKSKKNETIDKKCKQIEDRLLLFELNFSEVTSMRKSTPNELKILYQEWSSQSKKRKFQSEDLGEEIVVLYYKLKNISYLRNIEVPIGRDLKSFNSSIEQKFHKPDGLENDKFYVEVKMRAYQSSGTANEKIPSVAFKYADLPKKLKLYLLADDEHTYNTYWSKLIRGDIKSSNKYNSKFENAYKLIHEDIIENIIYGSEIAEEFEMMIKSKIT